MFHNEHMSLTQRINKYSWFCSYLHNKYKKTLKIKSNNFMYIIYTNLRLVFIKILETFQMLCHHSTYRCYISSICIGSNVSKIKNKHLSLYYPVPSMKYYFNRLSRQQKTTIYWYACIVTILGKGHDQRGRCITFSHEVKVCHWEWMYYILIQS